MELLYISEEISSEMKGALHCRLRFRAMFLEAVEMADSRASSQMKVQWQELLAFVPELKSSAKLGRSVPNSFSAKIQRRLASTVPPRPIVQVSQETAHNYLERLCQDGSIVIEVLEYYDSHSLMVYQYSLDLSFRC